MTDRNDMSNEDPCLHFEAKLVPDLRTKIKKRLIAAICDLKQPWVVCRLVISVQGVIIIDLSSLGCIVPEILKT